VVVSRARARRPRAEAYNCLFYWDLTPLSHPNGIGVAACFVLKKKHVKYYKV
jgi:hypothetical protein